MRPKVLVFRYVLFAILAILVNLLAQRCVLSLGESGTLFALAILTGTASGLILKYLLDKRWIFADKSTGFKAFGKKFSLYTAMGLVTTLIFWLTETVFWLVWQTDLMRELGAIIGLSIGYSVKYNLDSRYVFNETKRLKVS